MLTARSTLRAWDELYVDTKYEKKLLQIRSENLSNLSHNFTRLVQQTNARLLKTYVITIYSFCFQYMLNFKTIASYVAYLFHY